MKATFGTLVCVAVFFLASIPVSFAGSKFKEKWRVCASSRECAVQPLPCGGWVALNTQFVRDFTRTFGTPEGAYCKGGLIAGFSPPPGAACVSYICQPTDQQTHGSFSEWRRDNPIKKK